MKKEYREYLIIIFLLLGPFLDVTSFLGLPLSIIIRSLFLGIILVLLLKRGEHPRLLITLLLFSIISFFYQYGYQNFGIKESISATLKFLYLPVSLMYFKRYTFPTEKDKVLSIILGTYIGIYLLSYITGTGAQAYLESDGKSGFKGLFSSINEFSAIVIGLLPIVLTYLKERKKYILLGTFLFAILCCSLLIGTKVLLGGLLFSICYLIYQERERLFIKRTEHQKAGIIIGLIILLIVGGFLFTKTRTYQNMKIQQEFFQVEKVLSLDFINRVAFNNRLTFLQESYEYFKSQKIGDMLLGIGTSNQEIKFVEIDLFDILFRYGIIGFVVFFSSIICQLKDIKIRERDVVALTLMFLISLTSGHVLMYPAVSIYFGVICSKNNLGESQ